MPATFIGWKTESRRGTVESGGKITEDVAIVRGASSIAEAILASGMPAYGSALPSDPEQIVKRFEPQEINEEGTFYIGVVWQTPNSGSFNTARTYQGAEWTHSLVSQRVTVDLDSKPIGRRHYASLGTPGQDWTKFIHEGAQLGDDIQVPFSQVEISMPIPGLYLPGLVHTLIGRVNRDPMTLDGVSFAIGEVVLLGARAIRLQPQPFNNYDVRYLFAVGRSALPTGIPAKLASDLSLWEEEDIPLQMGYSVVYTAHNEAGGVATSQGEIAESRPFFTVIHRLFRDDNLGNLGVT